MNNDKLCGAELVTKAMRVAAHAHSGQVRKYTFEPYITHPAAVAAIVAENGESNTVIAAAFLHDTLEMTAITHEALVSEFGSDVADMVQRLTPVKYSFASCAPTRAARNAHEVKRLAAASRDVRIIKIADVIHNVASIVRLDHDFACIYVPEKRRLIDALRVSETFDAAYQYLWSYADTLLRKAEDVLERVPSMAREGDLA